MADFETMNGVAAGDIEAINGVSKDNIEEVGGLTVPSSGVTAADNLQHWWKMNEGSTSSATDYGLATASGTNLTLASTDGNGPTSETGGPSENGTPDYIAFDGLYDIGWTLLVDGSGNTPVGALIDVGYDWTLSVWLKDDRSSFTTWPMYWNAGLWGAEGFGAWQTSLTTLNFYQDGYSTNRVVLADAIPTSGWRNIVVTFDRQSAGSNFMKVYFDGSEQGSYGPHADSINTSVGTTVNSKLSFGGITSTAGAASYRSAINLSDIRMYNKVLSGAEISAIAAGDW